MGRVDGEGAKWPLGPTICCQKPKVPNNWLRETSCPVGGPRATQAGQTAARGTLGLCSQCWGSREAGLLGAPPKPHSPGPGRRLGLPQCVDPVTGHSPGRSSLGMGGRGKRQHLPQPSMPPIVRRSWLPLPLGEKALFSFRAAGRAGSGGCRAEGPVPPPSHSLSPQLQGEGRLPGALHFVG